MSRRILIVSPNFPPINTPDHQRVRMSLPYLEASGWKTYILALDPIVRRNYNLDRSLENTLPPGVKIVRTGALPKPPIKALGEANLAVRCLPYMKKAGAAVIAHEKIDLVYFSTTMFPVMALGPYWQKRFGIPYVVDFQDPWRSDYYKKPKAFAPPGGRIKYGLSQLVARVLEPYTLQRVNHIISVSPAYVTQLRKRYPWLRESQFTVLPFGAPEQDFECLRSLDVRQQIFDPNDGNRHWVYVGRGGKDLAPALRILFSAIRLARDRNPENWKSVKLYFVGTDYAPGERAVKTVQPIAEEFGIDDLVTEYPHRVPYFEALRILVDSDAILLVGSDDPGYTASKLYPCILAKRPILAVFHKQSTVVKILRDCNGGRAITFDSDDTPAGLGEQMNSELEWLLARPRGAVPDTDWSKFRPFTAREMTRTQCAIFDKCVDSGSRTNS